MKTKVPWWVSNADCSAIPVLLGILVATLIFGYQCFNWLQNGYWLELPLVTLFSSQEFFTNYNSWYNSPDSWLGLNKIIKWLLEKLPLSISAIGVGFFVKFFWETSVQDYLEKNPQKTDEE